MKCKFWSYHFDKFAYEIVHPIDQLYYLRYINLLDHAMLMILFSRNVMFQKMKCSGSYRKFPALYDKHLDELLEQDYAWFTW